MPRSETITIQVPSDLPADEREGLLLALGDHADVREAEQRDLAAGLATFVAVMKDVGTVAGSAAAVIALADKIKAWRESARQRGVTPNALLDRPGCPTLDLATASDSAVLAWLLEAMPSR